MKKVINTLFLVCTVFSTLSLSASTLVDPTRPSTLRVKKSMTGAGIEHQEWTLESTLVAPDRRVAVINGKLVSEGETVDGAQVVKVRALDVLIQTGYGRMTLQLLPVNVRKYR